MDMKHPGGEGVMKITEMLRKRYSSKPHAMNEKQAPSKIMRPVIKKAGLC